MDEFCSATPKDAIWSAATADLPVLVDSGSSADLVGLHGDILSRPAARYLFTALSCRG
jgi:hypothetical protein